MSLSILSSPKIRRTGPMRYPKLLKPDGTEAIKLPSGNIVDVPKTRPQFEAWSGEPILDTVRNPSLIRMAYQLSRRFVSLGYSSRTAGLACGLIPFEENSGQNSGRRMKSNCHTQEKELLENIYRRAGDRKGCWDVFCWKGGADHIWAESKLRRRDSIRE